MTARNPVLANFNFTDHDTWQTYHSTDLDAFMESKTTKELLLMCRERGIKDVEVYACGHRLHKKTYVTALREACMMTKITQLGGGQVQHTKVSVSTYNKVLDKLSVSTAAHVEVSERNSELSRTNRVLHKKFLKKEKEIETLKLKLQQSSRATSPSVIRVIEKEDTVATTEALRVANRDIEAFGSKMVGYERRIMNLKKVEGDLRDRLEEERVRTTAVERRIVRLSERATAQHISDDAKNVDLYGKYEKAKAKVKYQSELLKKIAAFSSEANPGAKRKRSC
jgi:hypothetical protein